MQSSHTKSTKYPLQSHWGYASVENFLSTVIYIGLTFMYFIAPLCYKIIEYRFKNNQKCLANKLSSRSATPKLLLCNTRFLRKLTLDGDTLQRQLNNQRLIFFKSDYQVSIIISTYVVHSNQKPSEQPYCPNWLSD